jgi:hypothetical protein
MPRTARKCSKPKQKQSSVDGEPQMAGLDSRAGAVGTNKPGREPDGRYTKGNAGGPGNPHARHCAYMLAVFRKTVSEEQMVAVFNALAAKAMGGDVSAAKVLLSYTIGKPGNAPQPDLIDRDEWEHFQKDAMTLEEMQRALGRLPCSLGNEIVSTARPIMSASWANDLVSKLRGTGEGRWARSGNEEKAMGPGARGENAENRQNQKVDSVYDSMLASYQASMASVAPIPNGEMNPSDGRAIPTRRGPPSGSQSPASDSAGLNSTCASILPGSSLHASRATPDDAPAAKANRIPNGNSKRTAPDKNGRNTVKKLWLQPLARKLKGKKRGAGKSSLAGAKS